MKAIHRLALPAALPVLTVIVLVAGCGKENPAPSAQNIPPDTSLELVADDGDTTSLRVHLRWAGSDPDGEVVFFWTRWDTLDWVSVARSESTFVLSQADSAGTGIGPGRHTFAVKAVDDRGAEDPTPAEISFTARNTLPETEIISGPASITCPLVRFEWRGWDYDGIVVGYGWTLWNWDYTEWYPVAWADSVGPDEVSLTFGPIAGLHRFDVWSIDDAGDVDPTPASWEFTSNPELSGSTLTVRTNVFGSLVYRGPVWPPEYDVAIPILEGEDLVFDWHATIEDCAAEVLGYSFAYDDTSAWGGPYSLDDTHFEVTPEIGQHSLYIKVIDELNMMTRARIFFEVIEAGLDEYVLIVDDYDWREYTEPWGTDADRDAFYEYLTQDCLRPVIQWDAEEHAGAHGHEPPDVPTLAGASTVIWYYDSEEPALHSAFDPFYQRYASLAGYARVGGNLIMAGWRGLEHILHEGYPIDIAASDSTQARVFVREALGIASAENSGASANPGTPWSYGYCFYGAVPNPLASGIQLEAMFIDSLGTWSPIYGHSNPSYTHGGLPNVEALRAWPGGGVEAQVIDAHLNVNFEGEPCTIVAVPEAEDGEVCYFGFPLYYLQAPQVRRVFHALLSRYGEL